MASIVVLDSSVLIEHLRAKDKSKTVYHGLSLRCEEIGISVIA